MKTADIIGLDSVRRDVVRDMIEMLQDLDKDIRVLQWWTYWVWTRTKT
jgi:hypothetical protein